jgi:hypothetical protein
VVCATRHGLAGLFVTLRSYGAGQPVNGPSFEVNFGGTHSMVVTTHAEEYWFEVIMDVVFHLGRALLNEGPIHVDTANSHTQGAQLQLQLQLPVTDNAAPAPESTLRQSLIHGAVRLEGFWAWKSMMPPSSHSHAMVS